MTGLGHNTILDLGSQFPDLSFIAIIYWLLYSTAITTQSTVIMSTTIYGIILGFT